MDDKSKAIEYISYNGLGRSPMIWGIPYMAGLAIMCVALLGGMMLGTFVGGAGWLFSLLALPIAVFVRDICQTDDKAMNILLLEVKWTMLRKMGGNSDFHGNTMAISPTSYGRKAKNVKRYFEAAIRR